LQIVIGCVIMKILEGIGMMKRTILMGLALSAVSAANAAINLTSLTYSENFDGLGNASAGLFTPNNTNKLLPGTTGWEGSKIGGGNLTMDFFRASGVGTTLTAGIYAFGNGSETDRALGAVASGTRVGGFGVEFVNLTGAAISRVTISFTQENWRSSTTTQNVFTFGYRTGTAAAANFINGAGFLSESSLNLVGPPPLSSSGGLDGNLLANQVARSATLTFTVPVGVGESIYLQWLDVDDLGSDAGLAIDNFSLTATQVNAVPEPFTMALGIAGAGVFVRRRLRRA
jgi:hypothetical protein